MEHAQVTDINPLYPIHTAKNALSSSFSVKTHKTILSLPPPLQTTRWNKLNTILNKFNYWINSISTRICKDKEPRHRPQNKSRPRLARTERLTADTETWWLMDSRDNKICCLKSGCGIFKAKNVPLSWDVKINVEACFVLHGFLCKCCTRLSWDERNRKKRCREQRARWR